VLKYHRGGDTAPCKLNFDAVPESTPYLGTWVVPRVCLDVLAKKNAHAPAGNWALVVQPVTRHFTDLSRITKLKRACFHFGYYDPETSRWSLPNFDSSVVQSWTTGWMIGGSSPDRGWKFLSSQPRPDRLWGPPSLLSNGYRGSFPGGKAAGA
jgi:hypothetical protein